METGFSSWPGSKETRHRRAEFRSWRVHRQTWEKGLDRRPRTRDIALTRNKRGDGWHVLSRGEITHARVNADSFLRVACTRRGSCGHPLLPRTLLDFLVRAMLAHDSGETVDCDFDLHEIELGALKLGAYGNITGLGDRVHLDPDVLVLGVRDLGDNW